LTASRSLKEPLVMMTFVNAWPARAALAVIAVQKTIARKVATWILIGHLRDGH
jgi:hypothetical protein